MTANCGDLLDRDDEPIECDREEGHTGRHAYRGEWAIISWSDR